MGPLEASLQARHEMERIEWQKELSAVKHEIDRLHGLQQKPRTCEASTQCHITEEARPRSSDPTYTNNRKIQITKRSAHPGDDPFDDDDLPETSEKAPLVIAPTKKSPSPVVIRAPAATPPVEDMNESDDDDLPETVEQRPPPAFDAASTPAVAFRKPRRSGSAQRRIDVLIQNKSGKRSCGRRAWSDQAKETAQHVQREAALKAQVAALTDQVDAWKTIRKADVAVQTDSNARAALLSHTLLKTVVGEMKEKNLRAVIDSLEGDLTASQERETRLRDEYKQLLETMVRHASQLDDAQKAAKDHQNIIDDQAKALAAYESFNVAEWSRFLGCRMEAAHESAKQAALDKEASLTKRLDELRTATADLQRREDVKKTMESTTQQQAIALMEDAGKREAALKAQVDVLESAARKREADQFKLVLAHDVETKALADQCRQLEATVAKLQAERALPREAPAPRFEQPSTPPSSPHPNAAYVSRLGLCG
ncbi:hypothetical protein DYB32_003277 [Aphanomyces invadans]|uniref:Uncharacterized protein n=1 Tax=Aphanomyces invadans TaxID=157072 RepID=A0A3R6WSE7_9STRA|nr:hypothetical protein DYB32_003277 [Aphanomyces invadans]